MSFTWTLRRGGIRGVAGLGRGESEVYRNDKGYVDIFEQELTVAKRLYTRNL